MIVLLQLAALVVVVSSHDIEVMIKPAERLHLRRSRRYLKRYDDVNSHLGIEYNFAVDGGSAGPVINIPVGGKNDPDISLPTTGEEEEDEDDYDNGDDNGDDEGDRVTTVPVDPTISLPTYGDSASNNDDGYGGDNSAGTTNTTNSSSNTTTDNSSNVTMPSTDNANATTTENNNATGSMSYDDGTATTNGTFPDGGYGNVTDANEATNVTNTNSTSDYIETTTNDDGHFNETSWSNSTVNETEASTDSPMVPRVTESPTIAPVEDGRPPPPRIVVDPNDSKYLICNNDKFQPHQQPQEESSLELGTMEKQKGTETEYLVRVKLNYKIWIEQGPQQENNDQELANTIYDIHAIMAHYIADNVLDCDDSDSDTSDGDGDGDNSMENDLEQDHASTRYLRSRQYRTLNEANSNNDDDEDDDNFVVKGLYGVSMIPQSSSSSSTNGDSLLPVVRSEPCRHHSDTFGFDNECYEISDITMTLKSTRNAVFLSSPTGVTCSVLRALRSTEFLVYLVQSVHNRKLEAFHIPNEFLPSECQIDDDVGSGINGGLDEINSGNKKPNGEGNIVIGPSQLAVPVMIGIAIGTTMASILACCIVWHSVCRRRGRSSSGSSQDGSENSGGSSSTDNFVNGGGRGRSRSRRLGGGGRRRRVQRHHGRTHADDDHHLEKETYDDEYGYDDDEDACTVETVISPRSVSTEGTGFNSKSTGATTPNNMSFDSDDSPKFRQWVQRQGKAPPISKSPRALAQSSEDIDLLEDYTSDDSDLLGATPPHYHDNPKRIKKNTENDQFYDEDSPSPRKTKTLKVVRKKKKKSGNPFLVNAGASTTRANAGGRTSSPTSTGAMIQASMMAATTNTASSSTNNPPQSSSPDSQSSSSPDGRGGLAAYIYGILAPIKEADDSAHEVSSQASSTTTDKSNSTPMSSLLDGVLGIGRLGGPGGSVNGGAGGLNSSISSSSDHSSTTSDITTDDEKQFNESIRKKNQGKTQETVSLLGEMFGSSFEGDDELEVEVDSDDIEGSDEDFFDVDKSERDGSDDDGNENDAAACKSQEEEHGEEEQVPAPAPTIDTSETIEMEVIADADVAEEKEEYVVIEEAADSDSTSIYIEDGGGDDDVDEVAVTTIITSNPDEDENEEDGGMDIEWFRLSSKSPSSKVVNDDKDDGGANCDENNDCIGDKGAIVSDQLTTETTTAPPPPAAVTTSTTVATNTTTTTTTSKPLIVLVDVGTNTTTPDVVIPTTAITIVHDVVSHLYDGATNSSTTSPAAIPPTTTTDTAVVQDDIVEAKEQQDDDDEEEIEEEDDDVFVMFEGDEEEV